MLVLCVRRRGGWLVDAYLIPENEDVDDARDLIRAVWPDVFAAVLEGWLTDPGMWPANRTWEMFEEWFEVQVCESLFDLVVGEPIEDI